MITKEQLESLGFVTEDGGLTYTDAPDWDFEFNIKTQELWNINDGFGEPEFLCKITDFNKLENIIIHYKQS
jgi:hypothetical protein